MARESYVIHPETGELVPKHAYVRPRPPRADLPTPAVIGDAIAPGVSQVSGQWHDTRSGLMRDYRDYEARTGQKLEIIGNDVGELTREPEFTPDDRAIDRAIKDALDRHAA